MAVRNSRLPVPLLRHDWPQVQVRAGPPFFGLVGLLLEGGGEAVAQELSAPAEQDVLAGVEHRPQWGLPGLLFQLGGQLHGHLDDLALQGGLRLLGRFGHFHSSPGLGSSGNPLPNTTDKCQTSLTHPGRKDRLTARRSGVECTVSDR